MSRCVAKLMVLELSDSESSIAVSTAPHLATTADASAMSVKGTSVHVNLV